jgi:hypothetical protein
MNEPSTRTIGGVREAPRHEIAGYGARGLSAAYGDLTPAGCLCGAALWQLRKWIVANQG